MRGALTDLTLRQMTCNAHGGVMRPDVADRWLLWLRAEARTLDVIYFQEVTDRVARAINEGLGRGWVLIRHTKRPGQGETAIAIRRTAGTVDRTRSLPMGGGRWVGRFTGRLHTPRYLLEVFVDLDLTTIVLGNIFAPPGVDVSIHDVKGQPDRVVAWRRYWVRFRRWANGLNRAGFRWAAGGDVQEPRRARGATSPHDTAERVGGTLYLRGIDGFLAGPGMSVRDVVTVEPGPGMDHHAVRSLLVVRHGRLG